jgi:CBS domain containing-hemolysin-like protein
VPDLLSILVGLAVVLVITALTGLFVAQEFAYMAVDRARLRAAAATGDRAAERALEITRRTSFMLSGAQLGITVTGLVVGYVAEPLIGAGVGRLLGGAGVPEGTGLAVGTVLALAAATGVQMVLGELVPKNLAIARPEPVARRLALVTAVYLRAFGWLIRVFDAASNLLLRALRIEPVHDVEHAATARDLEAIIDESRASGELPAELSTLLDRVLDFAENSVREAMVPRPLVAAVPADEPVDELARRMARGHSRYPVLAGPDDVVGVVHLRDVLALDPAERSRLRAGDVAREPVFVPESLPLPDLVERLRERGEELAVVLDEYGGTAGVVTLEDAAEELVGEITDEHDPAGADPGPTRRPDGWLVAGSMHLDEAERLLGRDLPRGDYATVGGLVIAGLTRLPAVDDRVDIALAAAADEPAPPTLTAIVRAVQRRVPKRVELRLEEAPR